MTFTTTTIKQSEQTYNQLMEVNRLTSVRETQVLELKATARVLLEQYTAEKAQEKEEEMEAERQTKKAAAIAKLDAQYAAALADLEAESLTTSVFEAGCESPTSPPPQPYYEVSQQNFMRGTFDEALFMQKAAQAEQAAHAEAEAATAALVRQFQAEYEEDLTKQSQELEMWKEKQQQQRTVYLGHFVKTEETKQVSVQMTTTVSVRTECGKEGCHNVWLRNPEQEAWTKGKVEEKGKKWFPRICCDECLAAKHAQQPQAATRGKPEGDNIKTSAQKSFHR